VRIPGGQGVALDAIDHIVGRRNYSSEASALRVVTDTGEGFEAGHGGESDRLGGWALPSI
jgi:hypothetical protein